MKIQLVQMDTKLGDKKANSQKMLEYIENAARAKVNLIVFPELALTGYACHQRFVELAEPVPSPSTIAIMEAARKNNMYVVLGLPELKVPYIYNSAVMFGPEGVVGIWRKLFLATGWTPVTIFDEGMFFKAGHDIITPETSFGRIGLEICRDIYYPEIDRAHSYRGAFLLICISAVPYSLKNKTPLERFQLLGRVSALQNTACFAYVNRVGVEEGVQYGGGSYIAKESSEIQKLASQGNEAHEEVLEYEINVEEVMKAKRVSFVSTSRADIMHKAADILNDC